MLFHCSSFHCSNWTFLSSHCSKFPLLKWGTLACTRSTFLSCHCSTFPLLIKRGILLLKWVIAPLLALGIHSSRLVIASSLLCSMGHCTITCIAHTRSTFLSLLQVSIVDQMGNYFVQMGHCTIACIGSTFLTCHHSKFLLLKWGIPLLKWVIVP